MLIVACVVFVIFKLFHRFVKCSAIAVLISCSFLVQADITLSGYIHVGDNTWPGDDDPIKPSDLTRSVQKPKNAINFSLSEDIELTKIILNNAVDIDYQLYFIIWDRDDLVIFQGWSKTDNFSKTPVLSNVKLEVGDYQIAVVGQCNGRGWTLNCNGLGDDYDDFSFDSITLKTTGISNHLSFIQRRHIGDSYDYFGNGYGGKWYPDSADGSYIDYPISVQADSLLASVNMNHYRDLTVGEYNIELLLFNDDTDELIKKERLYKLSPTGDHTWDVQAKLSADVNYSLRVISLSNGFFGDRDDISWDDIVVKIQPGSTVPVDHFRVLHNGVGTTCEPSPITIQACSNTFVAGERCDEVVNQTRVKFNALKRNGRQNVFDEVLHFTGSTDVSFNYEDRDTLELTLTDIGGTPYHCNNGGANGAANSCDIVFEDAGLYFLYGSNVKIENQVAGLAFSNNPLNPNSLYLKAIDNTAIQSCKPLFSDETVKVGLGVQCLEQDTCSDLPFKVTVTDKVTGKEVETVIAPNNSQRINYTYTKVPLYFNSDGIAEIVDPVFEDAGLIRLVGFLDAWLGFNDVKTISNSFAVRPYQFNVRAVAKDPSRALMEKDADGFVYKAKAGEPFTFKINAVNKSGVITTSYSPGKYEEFRIKLTRLIPDSNGVDGTFQYNTNAQLSTKREAEWLPMLDVTPFENGSSSFLQATYSEVGAIQINVKDKDYYGMKFSVDGGVYDDKDINPETNGQDIGRFTPDHFTLVSSSVDNYINNTGDNLGNYDHVFPNGSSSYEAGTTVLAGDDNIYQCRPEWNNSQWCTNSAYEPGVIDHDGNEIWSDAWFLLDTSSGITYMQQPALQFGYQLEARNSADEITRNYNAMDVKTAVHFVAESGDDDLSTRLAEYGGTWLAGVYKPTTATDDVVFSRLTNSSGEEIADGPYSLIFGVGVTDDDLVELDDMNMAEDESTPDRPLSAKRLSSAPSELRFGRWLIYDGAGPTGSAFPVAMELQYYSPNKAMDDGFIVHDDDSLTTYNASDAVSTLGDLSGSGSFLNGASQQFMISSGNTGTAILNYVNTPEWLLPASGDEPSANVEFGFFYGNDRVIYRQRVN